METILAAAFGRVIDIQKGKSDELTRSAAVIFESAHEKKLSSLTFLVMFLSKYGQWLQQIAKGCCVSCVFVL